MSPPEPPAETNAAPPDEPSKAPPKRCRCGHDRSHHMVSPSPEYTAMGWCLVLIGISAKPKAIRFVCRRCEQEIDRITDEETMRRLNLWS